MPLSTRLLAGFITYRVALGVYWLNILVPGVVLFWSWPYAVRHDLVKAGMPDTECRSICPQGIVIAQCLYAAGAALCLLSNWLSIATIVLMQLNCVIGRAWGGKIQINHFQRLSF